MVHSVKAWDFENRAFFAVDRDSCHFAYRDSVFKQHGWHLDRRVAITSVIFRLPKVWQPNTRYADVAQELAAQIIESPAPKDIACLLYTSPSPRDRTRSRMPSSA